MLASLVKSRSPVTCASVKLTGSFLLMLAIIETAVTVFE